ncbi:MAG: PhzF family phenazine biosynthesis protein [Calditrichae bacterium]|nr:PhzF family phenazine biosynthesis protein [Calditrichota bacterium]MCB9059409.1 PhzF family phenazine biosynthesis protein [Calditrichia bacterium]
MKIPIFQIDAFADQLFEGNPAAVCFLDEFPDKTIMHNIAAENNLSETAFLVKEKDGYHLRWFTPSIEVELCGHATLAAAHVLFKHLNFDEEYIRFYTKNCRISVKQDGDLLVMNFPARFPVEVPMPADLIEGLGAEPVKLFKDMNYLAVFDSPKQVRDLKPRFRVLSRINYAGIICTAADEEYDFVSRYFAPYAGINEDPVTGSAHTSLTTYWSKVLGKKELVARQISKRGGTLYCKDLGDRVEIAGKAITYLKGEIEI